MTVPRVGSFHPSPDAIKAIDGLLRVVKRAEGIGLLVGPTGCGKSLLLSCLRERLEGDYAVAILSGARICTRRGLWQSILSDLDEAYRGLDEEELRIGLVDRIRGRNDWSSSPDSFRSIRSRYSLRTQRALMGAPT